LAPAPSTKKSAPYDSKRSARIPSPGHLLVFTPDLNPSRLPTFDGRVTFYITFKLTNAFISAIYIFMFFSRT
jgi:hypothetical protein